jgi:hypothetical protein
VENSRVTSHQICNIRNSRHRLVAGLAASGGVVCLAPGICSINLKHVMFAGRYWMRGSGCSQPQLQAHTLPIALMMEGLKVLISRALFFSFRAIFGRFSIFRSFLGPDFPFFVIFETRNDGILARRMRPCTTAHHRIVLKQGVRPQCAVKKY